MALGKKIIEWNYADIVKGMSSSTELPDAGFASTTDGGNLITNPGVIFNPPLPTSTGSSVVGQMIASCEDPTGHYTRLFVSSQTSTQDGRFYSVDGSIVPTQRGSTDTSHNYIQGKTDMIAFDGEAYITNDQTLVRWSSIGASNTFDTAFLTFNSTTVPHPALTFNSFAYYGDGNLLLRQSAAGSVPTTILTLNTGVVIVALGIDPGSGSMLISLIGQINLSDQINSGARVAFYDGFSTQVIRYVQVDDMVTAFAPTEGSLYCGYGQNFGVWNGSGITFLRRLNIAFDNENLLYKQHFTSIGSTLFFIETARILAYGPVRQKGDNIFYPVLTNVVGGVEVELTHIANVGQNQIAMAYATSNFAYFTWNGSNASKQDIFSNSYNFDDELWVRRARIVYQSQVANGADPGDLVLYDQDGLITAINSTGLYDLANSKGFASAFIDINNINLRLKELTFGLLLNDFNEPSQAGSTTTVAIHASTSTTTFSHTVDPSLTNSVVLVMVTSATGSNPTATMDGVAMTRVSLGVANYVSTFFYVRNPTAGSRSITINWSVAATDIGVTTVTFKDAGTPAFNAESDGTATSITAGVTSTIAKSIFVEWIASAATTQTANADQIEISNFTIATSSVQCSSSYKPAPYAGTTTIGAVFGGSVAFQMNVVLIPPATTPINPGIRRVLFYGDPANVTGTTNP